MTLVGHLFALSGADLSAPDTEANPDRANASGCACHPDAASCCCGKPPVRRSCCETHPGEPPASDGPGCHACDCRPEQSPGVVANKPALVGGLADVVHFSPAPMIPPTFAHPGSLSAAFSCTSPLLRPPRRV